MKPFTQPTPWRNSLITMTMWCHMAMRLPPCDTNSLAENTEWNCVSTRYIILTYQWTYCAAFEEERSLANYWVPRSLSWISLELGRPVHGSSRIVGYSRVVEIVPVPDHTALWARVEDWHGILIIPIGQFLYLATGTRQRNSILLDQPRERVLNGSAHAPFVTDTQGRI